MIKKTEAFKRARARRKANQKAKRISTVRDRPVKSIIKAVTWRIIASGTTFGLAMLFFGDDPYAAQKATGVAVAESAIKLLLYFLHERAWTTVRWGRMRVIIRRNSMIRRKIVKRIKLNTFGKTTD